MQDLRRTRGKGELGRSLGKGERLGVGEGGEIYTDCQQGSRTTNDTKTAEGVCRNLNFGPDEEEQSRVDWGKTIRGKSKGVTGLKGEEN